mmetsp:Transcript_5946/g.14230  ORF Transcript_5946/g.14230 Transcript_5946/m.14230 type:complete len:215 (+) Transcript_5946:359-1003(+)
MARNLRSGSYRFTTWMSTSPRSVRPGCVTITFNKVFLCFPPHACIRNATSTSSSALSDNATKVSSSLLAKRGSNFSGPSSANTSKALWERTVSCISSVPSPSFARRCTSGTASLACASPANATKHRKPVLWSRLEDSPLLSALRSTRKRAKRRTICMARSTMQRSGGKLRYFGLKRSVTRVLNNGSFGSDTSVSHRQSSSSFSSCALSNFRIKR